MQRLIDRLRDGQGTPREPDDAVDLVFEEMKRSLADQQTQFEQINQRASYIFTGASITAAFQGLLGIGADSYVWSAPLLIIFLALVAAIVQASRNRGLSIGFGPDGLARYISSAPREAKLELIEAARAIHRANSLALSKKAAWMNRAEALLLAEISYLFAATIISHQQDIILEIVQRIAELIEFW